MRRNTLMLVSYILVFPVIYLLPDLAEAISFGNLPRWSLPTNGLAAFMVAGMLTYVLMPLNKRILEWRKSHGRDIEEEERYETEHGMIRLTPNDEGQNDSDTNS